MSSSPGTGPMETEEEIVEPCQCLWTMSKEPSRALTGSHMKNYIHTMQILDFSPWGYRSTFSCPVIIKNGANMSLKRVRWHLNWRDIPFKYKCPHFYWNRSPQIWLRLLHYFLMISSTCALNIHPIIYPPTAETSFDLEHHLPFPCDMSSSQCDHTHHTRPLV